MERHDLKCFKRNPRRAFTSFCKLALALSLFCLSFIFVPSANAISFQLKDPQVIFWNGANTIAVTAGGSYGMASTGDREAHIATPYIIDFLQLVPTIPLKTGQVVALQYTVRVPEWSHFDGFSCNSECMVLDQTVSDTGYTSDTKKLKVVSGNIWVQILSDNYWALTLKCDADAVWITNGVVADVVSVETSIDNQTQKQEEQWKKEEEQRKEDENKANQTGDGSKTDADNAQSDIDNASKGLLDILTDFSKAITGTSAGSCNISGDFGFFNVGGINLCTGAGKITPITNVVGSVMLIGLTIPACITLLHRFVDLYNEVTS